MTIIPSSLEAVDHIHISVANRVAAARWYADVLGLRRDPALALWAESADGPLMLSNPARNIMLALFERPDRSRHATIAFRVGAAAFLAWRVHLATMLNGSVKTVDHQLSWSLYFNDPDKNPFEITCYEHENLCASIK